ncbi:UMP kinase [Candidatus Woesearchaeota archaeon CG10_big_fil_rev_8_21_14_0_10_34_8]|nr:MAG: UMP kinase [Candidatus Woesearchaeota archaeon CG10_big_fil_rev_8_21_14_0_10_34_8]
MKDAIILSLGGSLIYPKEIDVDYLKKIRKMILKFVDSGKRFGIVCGGGSSCRYYIKKANEVVAMERIQNDRIGIATTWANAQLVRELFDDIAYEDVVKNYSKKIKTDKPIIIGAGWEPGCSTDKDAVLLGKMFNAGTIINLTNVDYVYDKDPLNNKDAKPIEKATWKEFKKIVGGEWKAGMNLPFDPVAAALAEKEGIKVIILNGHDLDNLEKCLAGKDFVGTVIS